MVINMSSLPQVSESEFEVMKIVWKYAPISTNKITEKLTQTTTWSPKTIQTLIKCLVSKSALTYEKQGRVFVYTPLVKENKYIGQESNSFLKRYYDRDIASYKKPTLSKKFISTAAFLIIIVILSGLTPTLSIYAIDNDHYQWNISDKKIYPFEEMIFLLFCWNLP